MEMLRRDVVGCMLTVLLSLAGLYVGCSGPSANQCGDGTKWDEATKKCIAELTVTCGSDTKREGDKCVPLQEVCTDGKVFDAKAGKCVDKASLCDDNSKLDTATGKCVPKVVLECGPDTEEKNGQCVPKKKVECGPNTVDKNNTCVPDTTVCGPGTKPTTDGKCEAASKLQCGPGTLEKNGECVPEDNLCQPGTVKDAQGRCIVEKAACDKGSEFDVNTKKCVATDKACGPNTAFTNGQCVSTDKVCAKGTRYDATSKQCLPDYCKAGDVVKNGQCVSPAEELVTKKDVDETENNDPALGGKAVALTPKAIGSQLVFTGTIEEPKDWDNNNNLDQDRDVYEFPAKAGQWYKVSVQSLGLPAPAYLIRGPGTKDQNGNTVYEYKRFGSFGVSSAPVRYIHIPADGTYQIIVLPSLVMISDSNLDGDAPFEYGPQGNKDWKYVGYIEQITPPTPLKVDTSKVNNIKGSLSNINQLVYDMDNIKAGELLSLDMALAAPGARMLLSYWDGTTLIKTISAVKDGSYTVAVPASGKLTLVVSWERAWSGQLDFDIRVKKVGVGKITTLKKDATDTFSFTVADNSVLEIYYKADAATFPASARMSFDVQDSQNQSIAKNDQLDDGDINKLYVFVPKAGTYKVVAKNTSTADQSIDIIVQVFKAYDIGQNKGNGDKITYKYSDPILKNEYVYVVMSFKEDVSVSGTITGNDDPKADDVDIYVYDTAFKALFDVQTATHINLDRQPVTKGTYLVKVTSSTSTPDLTKGFSVDLTLTPPPTKESEPNDLATQANPWGLDRNAIGTFSKKDDVDYYKFTLANDLAGGTFVEIRLYASSAYSAYDCTLTEDKANATPIVSALDKRYGCFIWVSGLKAGSYLFMAKYTGTSTNVDYSLSGKSLTGTYGAESNDQQAQATKVTDPLKETLYGEISASTDIDFFAFTVTTPPAKGKVWELTGQALGNNTSTTYITKATVVDGGGQPYGSGNPTLGKVYIKADSFQANSTYYIKVEYDYTTYYSYYDVFYKLNFQEVALNFETETTANNNDFTGAQVIASLPVLITGDVPVSDLDYYKFTLTNDLAATEKLEVTLNSLASSNTSSIQMRLYDSAQKLLQEVLGYGAYPKKMSVGGLKKGDYFIMIDRDSTTASFTGKYGLEISIKK